MSAESDSFSSGSPPPSARVDLITAAVLFVFALTVIALAWQMPTFTDRGGDPYTAPGIVPGVYGVVIAILAGVLGFRALKAGALGPDGGKRAAAESTGAYSNTRLGIVLGLALLFTVGLIGRIPFWAAAAVFITAFIAIFEWDGTAPQKLKARRLIVALLIGVIGGLAVQFVFRDIFLVRLP